MIKKGIFIAFLGADGSGKSTLISELKTDLADQFEDVIYYHLRPHFGQDRTGSTPVTDPHGKPPRSLPMSVFKLALWWADYTFAYWTSIRAQIARGNAIIFDRYYIDLLVDPKRYRYGGPMFLAHSVAKLIPKPDLVILLDAPADVLQSRKQEVSFEETRRQRQAYLELVETLPNGHVINAAQDLSQVLLDTKKVIGMHNKGNISKSKMQTS